MGGAFYWEQKDRIDYSEIITDLRGHGPLSKLPYYNEPKRLNIDNIYPFENNQNFGVNFDTGFFKIIEREDSLTYRENEELTEKFGIGLLDAKIGTIRVAKIMIKDLNNDGLPDVIVGENDWSDYFPDGKHWGSKQYRPFDENNNYRGGPLHGRVYIFQNKGEDHESGDIYRFAPKFAIPNIDQYGFCTPAFGDYLNCGRLDLVCGNFIHDLTYFVNTGFDENRFPTYASGINFKKLPGVINYVEACDFNNDGKLDLLISSENGHVYFVENTGEIDSCSGIPKFLDPIPLLQLNPPLKSDILPVPCISSFNSSNSSKKDIICGNGGGYFDYFSDFNKPKFIRRLSEIPRILPPYPQGSIQGPSEIGWGYTCPSLFDWNNDGLGDLIFSDINGVHYVCINKGLNLDRNSYQFDKPKEIIDVDTSQKLKTVWRVRPVAYLHRSGMYKGEISYLCLDEHARLAHFIKKGEFGLKRIGPVLTEKGREITFVNLYGGTLGRIKLCLYDFKNKGSPDIIFGFPIAHNFQDMYGDQKAEYFANASIAIMENISQDGEFVFKPAHYLIHKKFNQPLGFGHHCCSPEIVEIDKERFLVVGAEDGHLYKFNLSEFDF